MRLHERAEIGISISLDFVPESSGKLIEPPQYGRIIELSKGALVFLG